jgi:hypothetical protein
MPEHVVHPDFPHLPLGRKLRPQHDPASRGFLSRFASAPLTSRSHRHYGIPLNQRRIGSCTGNAGAQYLNCAPLHQSGSPLYGERDAAVFYSENTQNDSYDGAWYFDRIDPDGEIIGHGNDTGSDGLTTAKTLARRGLITRYEHAFGLQQALATLGQWPVITGVPWYEGMFTPDAQGYVGISGSLAGGHEFVVRAIDVKTRSVRAVNSWGGGWGRRGEFLMTWDTWGELLADQGDVTLMFRD